MCLNSKTKNKKINNKTTLQCYNTKQHSCNTHTGFSFTANAEPNLSILNMSNLQHILLFSGPIFSLFHWIFSHIYLNKKDSTEHCMQICQLAIGEFPSVDHWQVDVTLTLQFKLLVHLKGTSESLLKVACVFASWKYFFRNQKHL